MLPRLNPLVRLVLPLLALLGACGPTPAQPAPPPPMPPWLPHYDLGVRLDVCRHVAVVHQRVTWTNRHQRPAEEVVFNAHSHYQVPKADIGKVSKTLELMRMLPSDALDTGPPPLDVQSVRLAPPDPGTPGASLTFGYRPDNLTALVVQLPRPVGQGESIILDLEYVFRLPQKQGRYGQWEGVTFLSNWLPVLAYYDNTGWQPTPFIPWHQPYFNEAGVYTVRVALPDDQKIACSGSVVASRPLPNHWREVTIAAPGVRDFAFLCSARFIEVTGEACGVKVRCVCLPEHEFHAHTTVNTICEVLPYYVAWFGPYPWPELTFVESYFGWNGNECSTLVMIDERVFAMPHLAGNFVEYLVAHETCHQWWYNLLGTNGYHETWMDEAFANYFSNRFLTKKYGGTNNLLQWPAGLEWLPNISRDSYRVYGLYGTLGRNEQTKTVQDLPDFGNVVTLFSMAYDKGGKIVGMVEDRLGEAAFIDFLHCVYRKYAYQVIRVADFQHELEEYTGRSWDEFFQRWLYGAGLTDWSVETVDVNGQGDGFLKALHHGEGKGPYHVSVVLHQCAELTEQTVLGVSFDGEEHYPLRIPIVPDVPVAQYQDPPARVTVLPDNRVKVEMDLPSEPTQITVDPDKILVDRNPANNFWKTPVHFRLTPLYTFIDETSITEPADRWSVIAGPWLYAATYEDPWYTRSDMAGVRAGLYRTEHFSGGVYAAYRTEFRDVVVGVDGLWDHFPCPTTQVGFNVEHRLASVYENDSHPTRASVFGRYVFLYGSGLYTPPAHYVEAFGEYTENFLPFERHLVPGANGTNLGERFDNITVAGLHYRLDYRIPYWDPEGGYRLDATYAGGVTDLTNTTGIQEFTAQFSGVRYVPDLRGCLDGTGVEEACSPALDWLANTRLAYRAYGAAALPNQGQFFSLGGNEQFRGFDLRERQGSLVWVGSLEWRVPLWQRMTWDFCDHLAGTRNLYGVAFYDVGDAYVGGHSYGPVAHAFGTGLRLDLAWLGFVEHTTLRFDAAKTVNASTPWQFWFGLSHAF
jgi:Peptidase family M1 domain